MNHLPPMPNTAIAEEIREDHLRLAVMLDLIGDDLADKLPVGGYIAALIQEFEHHARRKEQALSAIADGEHAEYRRGHDDMRALLHHLAQDYEAGTDIRPNLAEVLRLFTDRLMPADAVFISR